MSFESTTMEHKTRVSIFMTKLARELMRRGKLHDNSKLKSPEREIYGANYERLEKTTFGTDEYREILNDMKPAIEHHYKENDHHPEHFEDGIFNMDLVQILEMLVDITTTAIEKGNDPVDMLPTFMREKDIPENYYMIL